MMQFSFQVTSASVTVGGILSKMQPFVLFQILHDIRITISTAHSFGRCLINLLNALFGYVVDSFGRQYVRRHRKVHNSLDM
jgi:hypothetical protein